MVLKFDTGPWKKSLNPWLMLALAVMTAVLGGLNAAGIIPLTVPGDPGGDIHWQWTIVGYTMAFVVGFGCLFLLLNLAFNHRPDALLQKYKGGVWFWPLTHFLLAFVFAFVTPRLWLVGFSMMTFWEIFECYGIKLPVVIRCGGWKDIAVNTAGSATGLVAGGIRYAIQEQQHQKEDNDH
jgi:hypothetical protein